MNRRVFLVWLLSLSVLFPIYGQDKGKEKKDKDKTDKKKSAKEEADRKKANLKDYHKYEKAFTPTDIKLLRFCTYRTSTGKYTGEYNGGNHLTVGFDGDGNPHTETERLELSPQSRRAYWKGNTIVVFGQAKDTLPAGTRLEISLFFYRPNSDPISWRDVVLKGKPKNGWWNFRTVFTFPKMKTLDINTYDRERKRSKLRTLRLPVKIMKGNYWIVVRYVKSKQNRYVRKEIDQIQSKLAKKDSQNYVEARAQAHVPRPFYDPTQESSVGEFSGHIDSHQKSVRSHYAKIIYRALKVSKELDRNFASAYKSNFVKKKKFDQEAWKQWLFSRLFRKMKRDDPKRDILVREIDAISTFGKPDSFNKESWKEYIKVRFMPVLSNLIEENFLYRFSHLAIPHHISHTYLNEMVYAILKKGINYTAQLYAAHKLPQDIDPEMPNLPIYVGAADPKASYLNMLYRRISRQVGISAEDLREAAKKK